VQRGGEGERGQRGMFANSEAPDLDEFKRLRREGVGAHRRRRLRSGAGCIRAA